MPIQTVPIQTVPIQTMPIQTMPNQTVPIRDEEPDSSLVTVDNDQPRLPHKPRHVAAWRVPLPREEPKCSRRS